MKAGGEDNPLQYMVLFKLTVHTERFPDNISLSSYTFNLKLSNYRMTNIHHIKTSETILCSEQMATAYGEFKKTYPGYVSTKHIDELRALDYSRLDKLGQVYLDYTGGGIYADSQLEKLILLLKNGTFGNPHSSNPTSLASMQLDEHARKYVLEYFNASSDEYIVIFTHNASGALKLVGESYPFGLDSRYLLTFDNHNAANGIREFARAKGASITYVPIVAPELRIDNDQLLEELGKPNTNRKQSLCISGSIKFFRRSTFTRMDS